MRRIAVANPPYNIRPTIYGLNKVRLSVKKLTLSLYLLPYAIWHAPQVIYFTHDYGCMVTEGRPLKPSVTVLCAHETSRWILLDVF